MKKNIAAFLGLVLLICSSMVMAKTNTTYVRMERTNCFGTCPNYVVEIYSNGLVRYSGMRFADPTGVYEKNIGKANTAKILKRFDYYRADTCKDTYDNMIADVPGILYNLKYKGKDKKIYNAHFGPGFLTTLAGEVDQIALPNVKGWKKIRSYKEQ